MIPVVEQYSTPLELAQQLARSIASTLSDAIAARGKAVLALSGGSTPRLMLQQLSAIEIDWAQVTVLPVDERWVAQDHPDSNLGMFRQALLTAAASAAQLVSLTSDAASPALGEAEVNQRLIQAYEDIDLLVLGMGADGHTASFFTGAPELASALDRANAQRCQSMTPPVASHSRMTLTLAEIVRARQCILHFEGAEKMAVYTQALEEGDIEALPVRSVLRALGSALTVFYTEGANA